MHGTGADDRRFRKTYDEVYPILIRMVYRITSDLEASEELCQEAFVRFYANMARIPEGNDSKYWLLRVAKNLAFNYEKRSGRERRAFERAYNEPKSVEPTGEQAVLREESYERVRSALDKLPENLKSVIVMKEYGGLSYKEIGAALGISEANVKVRVYRARERLARELGEGDVYVP
jgi:RNA polymerase sigma-70 factor (ECF subfamily)